MAGADRITVKILEEARLQAGANIQQAKREAEEVLQSAREEAEKKKKDILDTAIKTADESRKRIISLAELEGRKRRLQVRQAVLEEVFQKAMETLFNMPVEKYEEILTCLVLNSVRTGTEEIVLSEKDKIRLGERFVLDINRQLAARGRTGGLTLSGEAAAFNGGFILKSGNMEVNQTFEALLKMKGDELEELVIKVLF